MSPFLSLWCWASEDRIPLAYGNRTNSSVSTSYMQSSWQPIPAPSKINLTLWIPVSEHFRLPGTYFFFFYCGKLRIYVKVEERWWAPWLPTHHSVSTIINSRPSQFQANPLLLPSCHMPLLVLVSLVLPQGTRFSEISPCPVPLYILTALSKISCVG